MSFHKTITPNSVKREIEKARKAISQKIPSRAALDHVRAYDEIDSNLDEIRAAQFLNSTRYA